MCVCGGGRESLRPSEYENKEGGDIRIEELNKSIEGESGLKGN